MLLSPVTFWRLRAQRSRMQKCWNRFLVISTLQSTSDSTFPAPLIQHSRNSALYKLLCINEWMKMLAHVAQWLQCTQPAWPSDPGGPEFKSWPWRLVGTRRSFNTVCVCGIHVVSNEINWSTFFMCHSVYCKTRVFIWSECAGRCRRCSVIASSKTRTSSSAAFCCTFRRRHEQSITSVPNITTSPSQTAVPPRPVMQIRQLACVPRVAVYRSLWALALSSSRIQQCGIPSQTVSILHPQLVPLVWQPECPT